MSARRRRPFRFDRSIQREHIRRPRNRIDGLGYALYLLHRRCKSGNMSAKIPDQFNQCGKAGERHFHGVVPAHQPTNCGFGHGAGFGCRLCDGSDIGIKAQGKFGQFRMPRFQPVRRLQRFFKNARRFGTSDSHITTNLGGFLYPLVFRESRFCPSSLQAAFLTGSRDVTYLWLSLG